MITCAAANAWQLRVAAIDARQLMRGGCVWRLRVAGLYVWQLCMAAAVSLRVQEGLGSSRD